MMKKIIIALLTILILFSFFQGALRGKNVIKAQGQPIWPMFRYDVKHTGLCPYDTSKNNGSLKWKFKIGETVSSPSIAADGTIYVGSDSLYAINPNGTLKWKFQTSNSILSSPAIASDGTIYIGSWDYYFYAINPDGTLKWKFKTGWIYSSPAIASDGTIYVGSEDSYLYAFLYAINPDGSLKWEFKTGSWIDSSPSISSDGTVYVGSKDCYFYAIYPNGTLKWRYQTGSWIESSPAIASDGTIYVGSDDDYLYAINTINTYTIIAKAGSGGSISPSDTTAVNSGESKTFTITPNTGYKISNVKVDGVSVGAVLTYTFTNVISNHTIETSFEKEVTQTVVVLQIGKTSFTVNGVSNTLDSPPVIKNNRTLLPIRAVIEALGGTVGWDATEKKVTVSLGSTTIELWIGKNTARVNGITKPIDSTNSKVVPEIINSRTMLPLRFVTENLGCDVQWDGPTQTITITYQG
jgi:outer membrane protein assembly factor BamB